MGIKTKYDNRIDSELIEGEGFVWSQSVTCITGTPTTTEYGFSVKLLPGETEAGFVEGLEALAKRIGIYLFDNGITVRNYDRDEIWGAQGEVYRRKPLSAQDWETFHNQIIEKNRPH